MCRPRLAALRELSDEATRKRRAKWARAEQTRRDKVLAFGKLPPEQAAALLAEVRAERAAREGPR